MSALELKPCPFCGGTPKEIVDATRILGVHRIVHRCAVIPPFALEAATPEGVSEQWNRRADLPPGYVILSPDEVRALDRIDQGDIPGVWQEKYEAAQAIIRSLKGGGHGT